MTVAADLERLADRLRTSPPRGARAQRVFAFATRLAELGGAPVALPWVGEHALGDQVAVLARELLATDPSDEVLAEVREALRTL